MSALVSSCTQNGFSGDHVSRLNTYCQANGLQHQFRYEANNIQNGSNVYRAHVSVGTGDTLGRQFYSGQWQSSKKKAKNSAAAAFLQPSVLNSWNENMLHVDEDTSDDDNDDHMNDAIHSSTPKKAKQSGNEIQLSLRFDMTLAEVNKLRAQNHLPPLVHEKSIQKAKREAWSVYLAKLLSIE